MKTNEAKPFDEVGAIIEYEGGDISAERFLELFSHLVKTGHVWQLQGFYGRTAQALIDNGLLTQEGEITGIHEHRI